MSLKKQALSGVFWTFLQQFSNQLITFLVSIILARMLLPEEFGLIAMIGVFYGVARILIESGLTQSIIRSDDIDDEEYSTIFFFNFFLSILIYFLLFQLAPLISVFFKQDQLINIVRAYGVILIINSLASIQFTKLSKNMNFKTQIIVAIPSLVVGSSVGIILAYNNYGVWSLIYAEIVKALLSTIQVFLYSKWMPSLKFNFSKLRKHLKFGMNMMFSHLLEIVFKNIYVIFIGKYFSAAELGYYSRADTLKQLPVSNLVFALNKVTYPIFSKIKNDDVKLKSAYKTIMQLLTVLMAPSMIFLGVLAKPLIILLFSEKWIPAVPYFQILVLIAILHPLQSYNLNILLIKGKSELYLKLEIAKKVIILSSVLIVFKFGILAMLWSQVFLSIVTFIINSYFAGRLIDYGTKSQIKDITKPIIVSFLAGFIIYFLDIYIIPDFGNFIKISLLMTFGYLLYYLFLRIVDPSLINNFKVMYYSLQNDR